MTFFVCVSLPVFEAKPQQILHQNRIQNPKRSMSPGGGGGTLNFLYICRLELFFWVQNFEFQYFLGFSKK